MPIKRPSCADTDEDLMHMQNEFLRDQARSVAQGINNENHYPCLSDRTVTPLDKQASGRNSKDISVINEIKECITSNLVPVQPSFQSEPFPTVFSRSRELKGKRGKKSVFAKEMESLKQKTCQSATSIPIHQKFNVLKWWQNADIEFHWPGIQYLHLTVKGKQKYDKFNSQYSGSIIIDGTGLGREEGNMDAKRIHEENLAKISAMSEEDIINYQKQLLEHLGQDTVNFIKTKKINKPTFGNQNEDTENAISKEHFLHGTFSTPVTSNDSLNEHTAVNLGSSISHLPSSNITLPVAGESEDRYECSTAFVRNEAKCVISKENKACVDSDFAGDSKCDQTCDKVGVAEDELPIDLKEARKWVNMNKIEYSKLAWMTLLPKPKPINSKVGYPARFDFEGKLLSYEKDIPTQKGLHHHSEDPEVPGYTIEELFLLIRSSVSSQRITALQTLARVLENNWSGMFDDCFVEPLLPQLLQAGIVPLLRWSLDNSAASSLPSAVQAINSLIVCKADEFCLDRTFSWINGYVSPFLTSSKTLIETTGISQEELTDLDIIKMDVIKGFLRMDILPRLRYILEICHPSPTVSYGIFQILIRIARHSYESSTKTSEELGEKVFDDKWLLNHNSLVTYQVLLPIELSLPHSISVVTLNGKLNEARSSHLERTLNMLTGSYVQIIECPYLLETIFQKFLSLERNFLCSDKSKELHSYPVNLALKLMRVISSSNSELAVYLVDKHHLDQCLTNYLTLDPSNEILSFQEMQKLSLESLRTWQILLTYGLCANIYIDLLPSLFGQLKYCQSLSIITDPGRHSHDYGYISSLLKVLEVVVVVASECNKSSRFRSSVQLSSLTWNHVSGLIDITEDCLKHWLHEFSSENVSTNGTVLLASCLDFISLFYQRWHEQNRWNNMESLSRIENLYKKFLLPTLRSENFSKLLDQLRYYSVLSYNGSCGTKRNSENLTSLGSILWCDDIVPLLKEGTPFPLVSSVINLSVLLKAVHSNLINEVPEIILQHPSTIEYIRKLAVSPPYFSHWFDRFEVNFICQLMSLSSMMLSHQSFMWHRLALSLLSHFRCSCDWLIKNLMISTVFGHLLLLNENHKCVTAEKVIQNEIKQQDPSDHTSEICYCNSFHPTKEQLSSICSTYVKSLLSVSSFEKSRCIWERDINKIDALSVTCAVNTILSQDWPYTPILNLYKKSKNRKIQMISSAEVISTVNNCLKWILFSEILQLTPIKDIPPALRYCNTSTVFLIDDQLFYDDSIRSLLQACLHNLLNKHEKFDFKNIQWTSTGTFEDIYQELLKQFEAVSYKDHLFANYVLVPLQQYFSSRWRKVLLIENPNVVYMLSVPLKKLFMPIDKFLEPHEMDTELLTEYFKMLLSGALSPKKCPLIYLMAVHHLHHFIYLDSDQHLKVQKALLKKIIHFQTKEPMQHILLYSCPDEGTTIGFQVFPNLSSEHQRHLNKLNGESFTLQI